MIAWSLYIRNKLKYVVEAIQYSWYINLLYILCGIKDKLIIWLVEKKHVCREMEQKPQEEKMDSYLPHVYL